MTTELKHDDIFLSEVFEFSQDEAKDISAVNLLIVNIRSFYVFTEIKKAIIKYCKLFLHVVKEFTEAINLG